jgi:hypothetical protein
MRDVEAGPIRTVLVYGLVHHYETMPQSQVLVVSLTCHDLSASKAFSVPRWRRLCLYPRTSRQSSVQRRRVPALHSTEAHKVNVVSQHMWRFCYKLETMVPRPFPRLNANPRDLRTMKRAIGRRLLTLQFSPLLPCRFPGNALTTALRRHHRSEEKSAPHELSTSGKPQMIFRPNNSTCLG